MQVDDILFSIGNCPAKRLWPADMPIIRTFNQQCSDFFMLQNGTLPNQAEAEEIFNEVPPGRSVEDKLPIGVFDSDNTLIGLIDVLRHYRTECQWWIGLMLLIPGSRNAGLGTQIHGAFANYASECGAKQLLLAVLEENTAAHRFWSKLGYRKVKDHPPKRYGFNVHASTEYEKPL
jgi:RimJ/RimL family protein N-acetyltransferase